MRNFVEAIGYFGSIFIHAFDRESLHAKMLRIGEHDPRVIYKGLNNLQRRGMLRRRGDKYLFTKTGKEWLRRSRTRYHRPEKKAWDGKWRLVIFDVPQELHQQRLRLRARLKKLGFYQLQKSVLVFPYPCEEELGYLCGELGVTDYVDVILAESAGMKTEEIKKWFVL